MPTLEFPLPTVESGGVYAPGSLALEILNLQRTDEDTLRSVRGPCPYVPDYGAGYPFTSETFGVFHAVLDGGMRDVLLVRAGGSLMEQRGWAKTLSVLQAGLSQDSTARYPDQFCEVGGKIVWTNGVDRALVYDGYILLPLGYDAAPGTCSPVGPTDNGHPVFANEGGYSHPGKIGTPGDTYDAQQGTLLAGAWYYAIQFEDAFGNLSPLSPLAGPVSLRQERTMNTTWNDYAAYPSYGAFTGVDLGRFSVRLDDLTRQFFLHNIPVGPEGTVARRIYRSRDALHNTSEPRLLVRIPDNVTDVWPDNTPDAGLGDPADRIVAVPTFSVVCPHRGGLAIASGAKMMVSDPGFLGTFREHRRCWPDPNGGEVTALASYNGQTYAFTESGVFLVEDDGVNLNPRQVAANGCVAPSSVRVTPYGLYWLGPRGFSLMRPDGTVLPVSEEIARVFTRLNPAALSRATATWNPTTQEYVCAVPEAGSYGNGLLLCHDGKGWREQRHGVYYTSLCTTKDWRQYVLGTGKGAEHNVFVLDHEVRGYNPPTKDYAFRSQWLRYDPTGRLRFNVDAIYIGFLEHHSGNITVSWYQNGRRDVAKASKTVSGVAPDMTETFSAIVLGTGKTRRPRLFWRRVDVRLASVDSFAFDITSTEPVYLHLAAFAFEGQITDPHATKLPR